VTVGRAPLSTVTTIAVLQTAIINRAGQQRDGNYPGTTPRPGILLTFGHQSSEGAMRVEQIYDFAAGFYDYLFGRAFQQGRERSTDRINARAEEGAKILEVGLGTGLSLPLYRSDLQITGVDISEKMLDRARRRVESQCAGNEIRIVNMDATDLQFEDNSFDFVVAMYVASVVPDPAAFLSEISRVCKVRGEVIVVNHFASSNRFVRAFERLLAGLESVIGFKSDFPLEEVLNFSDFQLIRSERVNAFRYWHLLHFRNAPTPVAVPAPQLAYSSAMYGR
jgi:phosphatidylethanolamine/phosphatidyl-N-methylethanolamine N-methyltransferase